MRCRRAPALVAALALAMTVAVAGCGTTSLSAKQLATGAHRVCLVASRRLNRISTPQAPTGGTAFLTRGINILKPELVALKRLRPGGSLATPYARAIAASENELAALHSTLQGLKTGDDPVVAIKTLQQELLPLEQRADEAWSAVGVSSCAVT